MQLRNCCHQPLISLLRNALVNCLLICADKPGDKWCVGIASPAAVAGQRRLLGNAGENFYIGKNTPSGIFSMRKIDHVHCVVVPDYQECWNKLLNKKILPQHYLSLGPQFSFCLFRCSRKATLEDFRKEDDGLLINQFSQNGGWWFKNQKVQGFEGLRVLRSKDLRAQRS